MNAPKRPDDRRPNHLAGQTSPYLLQHLYNPVDWHAWGPEALERARREDKPIFLSIGYAACHWCHVMERESFEDPEVAELLNRHFVPIKVDREERPDLDDIYMNAVQLMTGHGGWPLNVFLTPGLRPFLGGTYFAPDDRYGRPGFGSVLRGVHEEWTGRRAEIDRAAAEMTERLRSIAQGGVTDSGEQRIDSAEISRAVAELAGRFEPRWGGFSPAPKFPSDGPLTLLLQEHVRSGETVPLQLAETTLDQMALGGMYDHVGGGFARYSVDERWLVPHFEKMLYNQALLVPVYLDAWLITAKPLYRRVVEQTLDFVRREMTDAAGGFYSSLDADSEGEEGKFYVWTPQEVTEVLGSADGELFCKIYGVTAEGNFEGRSIPNLLGGTLADRAEAMGLSEEQLVARLEPLRRKLLAARQRRLRPRTDDKVLTAWNGLMITAYARAHQLLGREDDLRSARHAADFVLSHLLREDRLLVSYREGQAKLNGYLDDFAFLVRGLLDLYETCFDPRYLERGRTLARTMVDRFEDSEHGGFYFTSDDHESLLTRNRSLHDGALPSGVGVATELLLRLAVHCDEERFRLAADRTLKAYRPVTSHVPSAYIALLVAADLARGPLHEVAIVGSPDDRATRELLAVARQRYVHRPIIQAGMPRAADSPLPLLAGKQAINGKPTAYVCRNYACQRPTTDPRELGRQLGA